MGLSNVLSKLPLFSVLLVSCETNLFSKVNPKTHIISLYAYLDKVNNTVHTSSTLDKIVEPLGVRWLIFRGNRNNNIVSRGTYRLTQPSNLIVIPLNILNVDSQARNVFIDFSLFTKVTSTLIIFLLNKISSETETRTEQHARLTIAKYTVNIQAICLIAVSNFIDKERFGNVTKYLTTSHFNIPDMSESLVLGAIENPRSFHRAMLRSGNVNIIGMVVFTLYPEFFDPTLYGNNRNACKNILFGSPSKAYLCVYSILSALHISKVHNVTVNTLHVRNSTEQNMAKTRFLGQYILDNKSSDLQDDTMGDLGERTKFIPQSLYFQHYYPEQLIYCKRTFQTEKLFKNSLAYWKAPLTKHIVIFILLLMATFSLISRYLKKDYGVLIPLGLFLRQSQPKIFVHKKSRWFLIITLIGMFTCLTFENVLTSTILVPEPPSFYNSIKEILDAGYKILWYPKTMHFPPESYFGKNLENRGLTSNEIGNYFETVPSHLQENVTTHATYLVQKYALFVGANSANMWIHGIEQHLANKTVLEKQERLDRYSCHAIPDIMDSLPFFVNLHVVNRDWILETLESLRENGLDIRWDIWSDWAYKFHMKYEMEIKKTGNLRSKNEYIDSKNLYAIFLFWAASSAFAGLICLSECVSSLRIFKFNFSGIRV